MSDSGVPEIVTSRGGVVVSPDTVRVGDVIRLEFGNGNYTTGEITHDGTTWWCNGNDIHGKAYDPEFNEGRRRVVLLKRDGRPVEQVLSTGTVEPEWAYPAPPPGTRPEFEVPWMSVGVGDEVRLEFDDDSAVPHVSGIVADSGDGLCVYVTRTGRGPADKEYGYQIDRPNRRVIMLRRAHEVELDRVTGVDKLRAEWAAASNVLLGCLMLGPAAPKVPENPGLMLLAMLIQERIGGLLRGIEDNERAAAVLADNGYASNAPFPLAASVGTLLAAAKHLEQERRANLGTSSDFGLARNVAVEAGFEEETLAGAVRAMASRITELEGAAKLHEAARRTADGAAREALDALEQIRAQMSETIVSIPDLPVMVARKIADLQRENRALAQDAQSLESKYGTAIRANEQANQSSVVQRQALEGIREVLETALPEARALDGYRGFPAWVGKAIAEARRAGRPLVAGGPNGLSDRIINVITGHIGSDEDVDRDALHEAIMAEVRKDVDEVRPPVAGSRLFSARLSQIINSILPPAPSVTVNERERLHDAILTEFYAHPGERLARPAAAFLADQLVSDVGEVLDTTPESEQALRTAFIQTVVEFFADGEDDEPGDDGAPPVFIDEAFVMLGKTFQDAGKELLRRWESITGRKP